MILLTWRLTWYPPVHFPNDWVIILCLFWMSTVCIPRSRWQAAIQALAVLWLFTVYSLQHFPLMFDHLRLLL